MRLAEEAWLKLSPRKSRTGCLAEAMKGIRRHACHIHHLRYSSGSNNELQTQIELSTTRGTWGSEEAALLIADAEEVGRMLTGIGWPRSSESDSELIWAGFRSEGLIAYRLMTGTSR